MKLSAKGRFAPPPSLPRHAQRASTELAAVPDVHARAHWLLGDETVVDGADFYLGEEELGHIHLDAQAHVALPVPVVRALIDAELGSVFPWGSSFVAFDIASAADVAHALWLFELSIARRRGATVAELLGRVTARVAA